MPWGNFTLNDGSSIPGIAFGTWTLGNGQDPIDYVDQALEVGFHHVDTAQIYRNEVEAGVAIRESGLARNDIFVTTKWSGMDGLDIATSIQNSLKNLGVSFVDLYLIHSPALAVPDIPTVWAQMEKVKEDGFAKSIGISNFDADQINTLLAHAKVKPAVNQILFHPYVYERQLPILDVASKHGIIIEAYSLLIPITRQPGGPLDKPLKQIAERLNASTDQVLMAWAKAKGVVVVTMSRKRSRLEGYLKAGDIELTTEDIATLDEAGSIGSRFLTMRSLLRRGAVVGLVTAGALALCSYMGVDVF